MTRCPRPRRSGLFGLVHVYDARLVLGTTLLELLLIPLFLAYRNVWPLGVLVPAADPAAMAEAFVALAADGARRKELGARAARDAAVRHSLPVLIETYQNLYDELRGTGAREMGFRPAA